MADNVNHPSHYETGKFECIDVMLETQGLDAVKAFCICNAFKYIYRHNGKNGDEDIRKAKWYIDKYVELVDKEQVKNLIIPDKFGCGAITYVNDGNGNILISEDENGEL